MKRTDDETAIQKEAAEPLARRFHDALEGALKELESRSIPPCAVTDEARRAVETRLRNLPRLYDALERADGLEALLMSLEIRRMEKALEAVCGDERFPLIPIRYFQNADERQAADALHCDKVTVWRNRKRLLDALAIRLMGAAAWETSVPSPSCLWAAEKEKPLPPKERQPCGKSDFTTGADGRQERRGRSTDISRTLKRVGGQGPDFSGLWRE